MGPAVKRPRALRASLLLPPSNPDHVIRRLSLQPILLDAMQRAMEAAYYTPHQRSLWIEEALAGLILQDPGLYQSPTGDDVKGLGPLMVRSVKTKTNVRNALDRQVHEVLKMLRTQYWEQPPSFSYIARCAIRHRLRHPEHYPRTSLILSDDLIERALAVDLTSPF